MHLRLRTDDKEKARDRDRAYVPPAEPEVISSLITSLSAISQPASDHFDDPRQPSLSIPSPISPVEGGFGVEYGAYIHALDRLREEDDINDLAASPPVVRTSKPPSGYSVVTAPRSPRRETSGGLKSLLRHPSRPSSKSSASSSHDDAHSIGNLSIERGPSASTDLRKLPSQDSWSAKLGRGGRTHKGLMYMSSRERLRATETEKKRNGPARIGLSKSKSFSHSSTRADQFLAETPIREEPALPDPYVPPPDDLPSTSNAHFLQPIPLRDSSLRKSASSSRRSSRKSSRHRSEAPTAEPILEFPARSRSPSKSQRTRPSLSYTDVNKRRDDILMGDMADLPRDKVASAKKSPNPSFSYEKASNGQPLDVPGVEDGAPSPSIYQNRRQSSQSTDRRKSGRATPDLGDMLKQKRSSSRLNRVSTGTRGSEPAKDETIPDPVVGYERPGSADSIDDGVEAYLRSPRLSQKIRHPQTGRVISFSEVGDPEGSAVFCCVGMGLTRYITAFYDELALALKLRLITPDRPGVGDSEPYDGTTTPLSWPDDVYAICQTLKVTKFSILAHSAGAIYALATALRMPQHIRGRIHLLAPCIPPSQMNVFGTTQALPPTNAIPTSQKILRALPAPFFKAANASFMTVTSNSITASLSRNSPRRGKRKSNVGPGRENVASTTTATNTNNRHDIVSGQSIPNGKTSAPRRAASSDQLRTNFRYSEDLDITQVNSITAAEALAEKEEKEKEEKERQMAYDLRLTHAIWDLATTGANPAVDLLVCLERTQTVGFRYVDITRPVVIHHGSRDTRVPVDNVRWLGKAMRRCEVRVLEGEGHGLMASASVMGGVLMEIGKEWEDWVRLTKSGRGKGGEDEGVRGRSVRSVGVY
ncbi:alpha/beta-hydrolase [Astrocystis sublimbata]|nr:alpha/beta-hydrolase [Astrocystis sublimbata]